MRRWLLPFRGRARRTEAADQTRAKLASYTASRAAYADLTKMLPVLREREALAKFTEALPAKIDKFEGARVAKTAALLEAFRTKHPDLLPFAMALVAARLKTPWHLIRLSHQACGQQERRRSRRPSLCDRGRHGAGSSRRRPLGITCGAEEQPGSGGKGIAGANLRHRIRLAGPHRSSWVVRVGNAP